MSSETMVDVKGLTKLYGEQRAVNDISFSVNRGEIVGFLGPNGAGKSTTMKMLTGFLKPSSGQAMVAGKTVADEPMAARRIIGYLPESAPLYDEMMVIDFLNFVADIRGLEGKQRQERLREVADRCGLGGVLGKDIGQLSKGYRQRVGLAQAIVHDPDLLILDEPTSGLDPNQIVEIRELIKDLGREKTVILSTHILPEVQATCGRIIIINEGKLVADASPDELTQGEAGAIVRIVVRVPSDQNGIAQEMQQRVAAIAGVRLCESSDGEGPGTLGFRIRTEGSAEVRDELFKAVVEKNLVLLDMHREQVSLEDTFRKLTRGAA